MPPAAQPVDLSKASPNTARQSRRSIVGRHLAGRLLLWCLFYCKEWPSWVDLLAVPTAPRLIGSRGRHLRPPLQPAH
jgi:hypothetical protein